jgi:hypothetical protein
MIVTLPKEPRSVVIQFLQDIIYMGRLDRTEFNSTSIPPEESMCPFQLLNFFWNLSSIALQSQLESLRTHRDCQVSKGKLSLFATKKLNILLDFILRFPKAK